MSFVLALFVVLLSTALAWAWYASLRRSLADDGRLRLREMLARHDAALPPQDATSSAYQSALAARRCVLCAEKGRCDAWLGSGARQGFEAFCPNAAFVARIARAT